MNLKKNLANIITLSRIVFSLLMIVFPLFSAGFWVFYSLAGASDAIDGAVARKLKAESKAGAILDSVADLVFFVVLLCLLWPKLALSVWMIVLVALIAGIRLSAYAVALIKFRAFVSLHTYLNKITGFALFLSPLLFFLFGLDAAMIALCSIALVSSLEELAIEISAKTVDRDRKGLFISRL